MDKHVCVWTLPVNLLFVYLYVWLSVPPRPNPARKETRTIKVTAMLMEMKALKQTRLPNIRV